MVKRTFASKSFRSKTFASGTWAGVAVAPTPPTPAPTPVSSGKFIATHDLLTPHVILVPQGSQWSREEAERWIHRLRRDKQDVPVEIERLQEDEEAEAIVMLLSLLL